MFIQVIEGKTSDPQGLREQGDRWRAEVAPGAQGYLGSTGGIAEDGTVIHLVRFEDEAAAQANSDRPEQTAWWNEMQNFYDGEPTFRNCTEVDTSLAGGSDDAGFVQVMHGRCPDKARLRELEKQFEGEMAEQRPDVIGSTRAWDGDHFTEAIYFTSEAEAREGEKKMSEGPDAGGAEMEEYMGLFQDLTYVDLKDPILWSP
jgi:hypothetical protein